MTFGHRLRLEGLFRLAFKLTHPQVLTVLARLSPEDRAGSEI